MKRSPILAAGLLVALSPGTASAELDTLFGNLPRPQSMGGAYTAVARDAASLFYNPAGLARAGGSYAAISFAFVAPNLSATSGGAAREIDSPGEVGYGFHFAWNPRGFLDSRLGLGLSAHLPHRRALSFHVRRADDPYFVLQENAVQLLEIRLGIAARIFDWLSAGGSVLLLGGLDGGVKISAPFQSVEKPEDLDQTKRTMVEVDAVLPNREFFSAGLQVGPFAGLTFGLTYREPTFVPVALPIEFDLTIITSRIPTTAALDVKVKYSPAQLTFGAAWEATPELLLSLDVVWAMYSRYQIPFANVGITVASGDTFMLLPPRAPDYELRDLIIPRAGVEWRALESLTLRAGYSFMQSFLTRSADPLLDNPKHNLSLGAGYALGGLVFTDATNQLDVLAAAQVALHTSRDTASYTHSGQVFAGSVAVELRY